MKLSKMALLAVRGMSMEVKKRVADACGITLQTFYKKIRENEINGVLTKAIAIETIAKETGIRYGDILDEDLAEELNGLENAKVS